MMLATTKRSRATHTRPVTSAAELFRTLQPTLCVEKLACGVKIGEKGTVNAAAGELAVTSALRSLDVSSGYQLHVGSVPAIRSSAESRLGLSWLLAVANSARPSGWRPAPRRP